MKKLFKAIMSTALAMVVLAGCTPSEPAQPPASAQPSAAMSKQPQTSAQPSTSADITAKAPTDKKVVVGVSLLTREHVFYNNIETALKQKAEELGYTLIVQDAASDANKQLSQVQDFINQGVDAIILCPTNSSGSKSMVQLANDKNIPVFTMDIPSDGDTIAHVSTDNYKGGQLAAEYLATKMLPGAKGDVAVVTYSEVESCVAREKGFVDYLKQNHPGINVVDIQNCSGDQGKAASVTQDMILKHAKLQAIFGVGDPFAMGALSAVKAANEDIKIIGFDGNPEGIEEIRKGELWVADVAQDPQAIAYTALESVNKHLNGQTVEKIIPIEPKIIDASTLQ